MYCNTYKIATWLYRTIMACAVIVMASCHSEVTPRPDGYFRIEPYTESYSPHTMGAITLLINDSAQCVATHAAEQENVYWLNVVYPRYHATIYLSYIPLSNNFERLMSESIDLVYRQNVITEQVEAIAYEDAERRLYATLYSLSPESATPLQFIATDSTKYLLRGALYFDTPVKTDSVAPSLQYIEQDIMQMIESITPITQ